MAEFKQDIADIAVPVTTLTNRQIRIAVSILFFCLGLSFASWASRIPDIKTSLGLNDAAFGLILLALPAGQLTAMPFSGVMVTRFGSKKVLRVAAILYALCLTNLGLATQPWHLAVGLYFFGICGNLCNISGNTQAIRAEKLYERPIMASFHGAWSTAGFTGAAIGLLMTGLQVRPYPHFCIVAVMIIVVVLVFQSKLQSGRSTLPTEKKSFFSRPDGMLVQLGIIGFCSMASEGAMFEWSGVYFKDVVHAEGRLIVLGYASFMGMMAIGRFVGDKLIEKYGRKRMLQVSGVMVSFGLLTAVFFPYMATATFGFICVGFGVSSIIPMVYSSVGRVSKIPPGMALAAVSSISFFGFLMGPPLIGYISQLFSLRHSFAVISLFGFAIAIMVSKLKALH
ncbi:MAG: MFS transporter [Chitinophagaceae bacterium]